MAEGLFRVGLALIGFGLVSVWGADSWSSLVTYIGASLITLGCWGWAKS